MCIRDRYSGMQEDALLDDFVSALKSKNIPEIIDLWIENHSRGLQYIKNNLSILACHISNQAILFCTDFLAIISYSFSFGKIGF